ncbi:MAG: class I SAM-dependent methyltransferase [Spirochaetia bacterium]
MGFLQRILGRKKSRTTGHRAGAKQAVPAPNQDAQRVEFFDTVAEEWDSKTKLSPTQEQQLAEIIDHVGIHDGQVVVDAGCGTGVLYKYLAPRIGSKGRVFGIDASPKMISLAEAKFSHDHRFSWHAGSVEKLIEEIAPEGIDRIICYASFPHFADQKLLLQVAAKALRPDGKLAIIHLGSSEEINGLHAGVGDSPVAQDTLPSVRELAVMAQEVSLSVQTSQEHPGLYFFLGASLKRS